MLLVISLPCDLFPWDVNPCIAYLIISLSLTLGQSNTGQSFAGFLFQSNHSANPPTQPKGEASFPRLGEKSQRVWPCPYSCSFLGNQTKESMAFFTVPSFWTSSFYRGSVWGVKESVRLRFLTPPPRFSSYAGWMDVCRFRPSPGQRGTVQTSMLIAFLLFPYQPATRKAIHFRLGSSFFWERPEVDTVMGRVTFDEMGGGPRKSISWVPQKRGEPVFSKRLSKRWLLLEPVIFERTPFRGVFVLGLSAKVKRNPAGSKNSRAMWAIRRSRAETRRFVSWVESPWVREDRFFCFKDVGALQDSWQRVGVQKQCQELRKPFSWFYRPRHGVYLGVVFVPPNDRLWVFLGSRLVFAIRTMAKEAGVFRWVGGSLSGNRMIGLPGILGLLWPVGLWGLRVENRAREAHQVDQPRVTSGGPWQRQTWKMPGLFSRGIWGVSGVCPMKDLLRPRGPWVLRPKHVALVFWELPPKTAYSPLVYIYFPDIPQTHAARFGLHTSHFSNICPLVFCPGPQPAGCLWILWDVSIMYSMW